MLMFLFVCLYKSGCSVSSRMVVGRFYIAI